MKNIDYYVRQPHFRAKLLGIPLLVVGVIFLFLNDDTLLKIGCSLILIGLFIVIMITEKTVPAFLSNAQIKGYSEAVYQIVQQLNLKGNAIILPRTNTRSEERVFIPLQNSNLSLPQLDNEMVFATGTGRTSMGVSLPPSGLVIFGEVEKETSFENTHIENLEEKLQVFVGMEILQTLSLKQRDELWSLTVQKPLFCPKNETFCKQYPCPSCSAVLTAISKATRQKIVLKDVVHDAKTTSFYFTLME